MTSKTYSHRSVLTIIFGALFLSASLGGKAQTIEPTYISVSDGVASSVVNVVIQDQTGLLWLTTESGIQNYDGHHFRSFRHEPENPNSLLDNMCWGITEDSNHNMWVGTDDGISRYDRKSNSFKNYPFNQSNPDIPGIGRTFYIMEDSYKRLWSAPATIGLLQYDSHKDEWTPAKVHKSGVQVETSRGIVLAIVEDQNAGLWTAMQNDGLYYCKPGSDIFEYVNVTTEEGIDFGTTDHSISALYVDSKNRLWITTRNGVHRLDPATGVVNTFITYNYRQLEVWNNWNAIREDADGNIWVANNFRGMLRFNKGGDTFEEINVEGINRTENNALEITLTTFNIDKSGIFWFGTRGKGMMKYDPVEKPFSVYSHNPNDETTISSNAVFAIAASAKDPEKIYVGLRGAGVNIMDMRTKEFKHFTWQAENDFYVGGSARSILETSDGHVLVGTWGDGIIEFDQEMNELKRIISDENIQGLSSNKIRILKEDSTGQIWIGTDQGLNIWDRKTNVFQTIENQSSRRYPTALFESAARALSSPDSISILAAGDGVSISRSFAVSQESTWLVSNLGEGDTKILYDYGWIETAAGDTVWSAFSGNVSYWAGGDVKNRMHLEAITLKPGEYTLHYFSDGSHSAGDGFNASEPDHPEWWGIAIAPVRDAGLLDNVKNFTPGVDKRMMISGSNIMGIELDNKTAWVATAAAGLNQLNLKTNGVNIYVHEMGLKNSLSSNTLNDICLDSEGSVWIGSENGLDKLTPETGEITRYTLEDGLPTNSIETIAGGNDGDMWVATSAGLSHMVSNSELDKFTIINYSAEDGTGGDIYTPHVGLRSEDGTYIFGGDHGLTSFRSISGSQSPPDILLSNFSISNKSVFEMGEESPLENSIEYTDEITLSHDQNDLSFAFTALHYANPSKNQYAHKLEGFDADWVYDNRNYAAYTNLDPGIYTLRIRASNAYGVWNEEGKSVSVTILAPWWRTWWAYGAYGVLFLLLLFAFDRAMRKRV
ncbi:MAG TPA: two-component regulator propeller domain-containing protein, partial [Cryomorphaceae bacterium]|nr:two-component regulator propeller domain-containing protein [Cryomorphaceae bacterium]